MVVISASRSRSGEGICKTVMARYGAVNQPSKMTRTMSASLSHNTRRRYRSTWDGELAWMRAIARSAAVLRPRSERRTPICMVAKAAEKMPNSAGPITREKRMRAMAEITVPNIFPPVTSNTENKPPDRTKRITFLLSHRRALFVYRYGRLFFSMTSLHLSTLQILY